MDTVLKDTSLEPTEIETVLYCAGPGSTLGVRLACIGLRALQSVGLFKETPFFSYLSLSLIAAITEKAATPSYPFYVITERRKDVWNCLKIDEPKSLGSIDEVENLTDLDAPYYYFPQLRKNPKLPAHTTELVYSIDQLPSALDYPNLFTAQSTPTPWDGKAPTYIKWSAERHR